MKASSLQSLTQYTNSKRDRSDTLRPSRPGIPIRALAVTDEDGRNKRDGHLRWRIPIWTALPLKILLEEPSRSGPNPAECSGSHGVRMRLSHLAKGVALG